jgi:predicted nucleic acid-binding protein
VPCFFWAEVGSALRKRAARSEIGDDTAREAYTDLLTMGLSTVTVAWLRAYEIAGSIGHLHVYDSCYLAVAEELGTELWTADQSLFDHASPYFPWVRLL